MSDPVTAAIITASATITATVVAAFISKSRKTGMSGQTPPPNRTIAQTASGTPKSSELIRPDDTELSILQFLASTTGAILTHKISNTLHLPPQKAMYHFERLQKIDLLRIEHDFGDVIRCRLTQPGRELLVKKGLL